MVALNKIDDPDPSVEWVEWKCERQAASVDDNGTVFVFYAHDREHSWLQFARIDFVCNEPEKVAQHIVKAHNHVLQQIANVESLYPGLTTAVINQIETQRPLPPRNQ